jgi:DNA (cytosine-5)-methyltransferase 1
MVSHVDLCSGIGGFSLGFRWAGLSENPYLLCDFEPWCRDILRKNFPGVPIADDVKEIASDPARFIPGNIPRPFILTAGYPCQPFSQAGRRGGKEDSRHIYPEISRIVSSTRPDVVVFENVYGHVSLGLDEVLHDLEAKNYTARTFVFPSAAIVGLPHQRNRLWIIAHSNRNDEPNGAEHEKRMEVSTNDTDVSDSESIGHGGWNSEERGTKGRIVLKSKQGGSAMGSKAEGCGKLSGNVSDSSSARLQGSKLIRENKGEDRTRQEGAYGAAAKLRDDKREYADKSNFIGGLGRVVNGIPSWVDEPNIPRVTAEQANRTKRLKGLGNAIVPQIAMLIGMTIKKELTK